MTKMTIIRKLLLNSWRIGQVSLRLRSQRLLESQNDRSPSDRPWRVSPLASAQAGSTHDTCTLLVVPSGGRWKVRDALRGSVLDHVAPAQLLRPNSDQKDDEK